MQRIQWYLFWPSVCSGTLVLALSQNTEYIRALRCHSIVWCHFGYKLKNLETLGVHYHTHYSPSVPNDYFLGAKIVSVDM